MSEDIEERLAALAAKRSEAAKRSGRGAGRRLPALRTRVLSVLMTAAGAVTMVAAMWQSVPAAPAASSADTSAIDGAATSSTSDPVLDVSREPFESEDEDAAAGAVTQATPRFGSGSSAPVTRSRGSG